MMFFTWRAGCTRSTNYIKLVASDVQPIANYYSFRWAPKIVRALDDLREPKLFPHPNCLWFPELDYSNSSRGWADLFIPESKSSKDYRWYSSGRSLESSAA